MKQEDKEILLKDLSARLIYDVICNYHREYIDEDEGKYIIIDFDGVLYHFDHNHQNVLLVDINKNKCEESRIDYIKPYLRPMSSMTEEEEIFYNIKYLYIKNYEQLDWFNAHHFDYRGLIEKGLALEAPKDMYK